MTTAQDRPAVDLYAHCPRWCDREAWHAEDDFLEDGIIHHGRAVGAGMLHELPDRPRAAWEVDLCAREVPDASPSRSGS